MLVKQDGGFDSLELMVACCWYWQVCVLPLTSAYTTTIFGSEFRTLHFSATSSALYPDYSTEIRIFFFF